MKWNGIFLGPSLNKDSIIESALLGFCRNIPCSPDKLLRTAYGVRNFSSSEMDRLFIKTEMYLKSKAAASASMPNNKNTMVPRSRSSDVLPTSQSQINIQMMSHTLTIREVKQRRIYKHDFIRSISLFRWWCGGLSDVNALVPILSFHSSAAKWVGFGIVNRVPDHRVLGLAPWDCSRFKACVPLPPTTNA